MIAILKSNKPKQFFFQPLLMLSLILFFTTSFHAYGQGNVVTGRVTSATGDPLPGVSILIKGTKNGTSTDNNGNFSLNAVNPNATLVISSSGYDRQEVNLNGRNNIP